jgi:hypothetical protein
MGMTRLAAMSRRSWGQDPGPSPEIRGFGANYKIRSKFLNHITTKLLVQKRWTWH